jgi:putative phage-type endonuclease
MIDRKLYIGGSDAAAVMGQSRYKTPLKLWAEKTGEIEPEDLSDREAVYWGNVLEEVIRKEVEKRLKINIEKPNVDGEPEVKYSKDYPFIGCQLDGENRHVLDTIYEFKTCAAYKKDEWEGAKAPIEYIIQCQHNMYVMGAKKCILACLIGGQQFVMKEIERDEAMIEKIVAAEVDFWNNYVLPKAQPIAMAEDDMDELFPTENGETIPLSEEQEEIIKFLAEKKAMVSDLKKEISVDLKMQHVNM